MVKEILYIKLLNTSGFIYGRVSTETAIQSHEHFKNVEIVQCRLFINPENSFLWTSLEGSFVGEGVIELKRHKSI